MQKPEQTFDTSIGRQKQRDGARVSSPAVSPARSYSILFALLFTTVLLSGCKPPGPRALWQGKTLLEKGKYEPALEKLRTATSLLTTNANAWNYLGLAYHYTGQPTEAEQAYRKALALDHDLTEAHFNLGCLLLEQHKPEAAKNELTTYILRRNLSLDGLLRLGSAQIRSRDVNGAEKSFTDAARLSPTNSEALNGLGLVRYYQRRPAEAAKLFDAALRQQSQYAPAILNQAVMAQAAQDRQTALNRFREYVSLVPQSENSDAANAAIQRLQHELPPQPVAQPAGHDVRSVPPPPTPVATTAPPAQNSAPHQSTHPPIQAPAIYPYRNLPKPAPTKHAEAEKFFAQGVQAQKEHRIADAILAYRSATKTDPAYYDAWYDLGVVAAEVSNWKTALDAYEHALAVQPDSLDARYNFALALQSANYFADAANELEKILVRYPNETRAHLAAGNLYANQLNQIPRAKVHYLRALELDPRYQQADAIRRWITEHP